MSASHDVVPAERFRPLQRAEYERMVALGMFEGEKVELVYGRLVRTTPQREPHAFSIQRLTKILVRALGDRAEVRIQLPLAASDVSEPEPDIAIVAPGDYLDGHPRKAHLVIEVAQSSLKEDRDEKGPLYAAAGVPEYWLVNIDGGVVEVYRDPRDGRYATTASFGRETTLAVPGFADARVTVRDVLPPA